MHCDWENAGASFGCLDLFQCYRCRWGWRVPAPGFSTVHTETEFCNRIFGAESNHPERQQRYCHQAAPSFLQLLQLAVTSVQFFYQANRSHWWNSSKYWQGMKTRNRWGWRLSGRQADLMLIVDEKETTVQFSKRWVNTFLKKTGKEFSALICRCIQHFRSFWPDTFPGTCWSSCIFLGCIVNSQFVLLFALLHENNSGGKWNVQ